MKIESLLNYIGHKSKIQEQIFTHLPEKVDGVFYDFFAGSAVIGLNAPYQQVSCVEINPYLSKLYDNIQHPHFLAVLEGLIKQYNLTNSSRVPRAEYLKDPNIGTCQWMGKTIPNLHLDKLNSPGYQKLLTDFNNGVFDPFSQTAAYMIATIYGRNSNVSIDMSTLKLSGGIGPLDFSLKCASKLKNHQELLLQGRHSFINGSYKDITPTDNDYCYFDPPYLASGFKYSGWDEQKEIELLDYIDSLPCHWALSNTLQSGKKTNDILIEWSKTKVVIPIQKNYRKWAGGGTETNKKSSKVNLEVLILSKDFIKDPVIDFGS
jgi:site-specific DNA-adenine methylase